MKVIGMIFQNGATTRSFQAGSLVVDFLKFRCWCLRNWKRIVRVWLA